MLERGIKDHPRIDADRYSSQTSPRWPPAHQSFNLHYPLNPLSFVAIVTRNPNSRITCTVRKLVQVKQRHSVTIATRSQNSRILNIVARTALPWRTPAARQVRRRDRQQQGRHPLTQKAAGLTPRSKRLLLSTLFKSPNWLSSKFLKYRLYSRQVLPGSLPSYPRPRQGW